MVESGDEWLQAAAALRSYVTAGVGESNGHQSAFQSVSENTVVCTITHNNLQQKFIEIRFDKHQTLDDLRQKIYQKTGTTHDYQHLQVYDTSGRLMLEIPPTEPSTRKLGYYSLQHGMRIHCVDTNPNSISRGGALEDVSLCRKYIMSNEEYNKRKNTLRRWGEGKKADDPSFSLAKYGKEHKELVEAKQLHKLGMPLPKNFEFDQQSGQVVRRKKGNYNDDYGIDSVSGIQVEMRCEVQPGGRRGTVKYVGEVPELASAATTGGGGGYWVGIVFDEPVGKSNGSFGGKKYFDAMPKFGGFCRGNNVQVGDFPERDLFDDDDDSSEDEL